MRKEKKMSNIQTIGVIGAGQMGAGIAHVAAMSGFNVILTDISEEALSRGVAGIEANMRRGIKRLGRKLEKGAITQTDHDVQVSALTSQISIALGNIETSTDLGAHAVAQLVVEAATENVELKNKIFRELSEKTPDSTILCSNTSSISITAIAANTNRPDKVMGMHFMNPVPVMKLVELIRGLATSDETYALVSGIAEKMGKTTVEGRDMPGFIVNRVLMPYINEAAQALYEGIASVEDIDVAMKLGTNVPMGPLTLADFIGLDTCLAIMEVLHDGFKDSKYRPSPLLRKYVEAGWMGRKSGRGFYDYTKK
jgi:3-hydroxybutyryl-CoA dehydrogenase